MISWIVATHDRGVLEANLLPTVELIGSDEIVVVEDAPSIAVAYNRGQARATQPVRCYVHHDVQILDLPKLRAGLLEHCPGSGVVGVIGSRNPVVPWWDGDTLGSVVDARLGRLDFGDGGPCAYLDGLLLATSHSLEWDESYPGWHLYDHDICQQMLAVGLPNLCLPGGHLLVRHETAGPRSMSELDGWVEAAAVFHAKWGDTASTRGRADRW